MNILNETIICIKSELSKIENACENLLIRDGNEISTLNYIEFLSSNFRIYQYIIKILLKSNQSISGRYQDLVQSVHNILAYHPTTTQPQNGRYTRKRAKLNDRQVVSDDRDLIEYISVEQEEYMLDNGDMLTSNETITEKVFQNRTNQVMGGNDKDFKLLYGIMLQMIESLQYIEKLIKNIHDACNLSRENGSEIEQDRESIRQTIDDTRGIVNETVIDQMSLDDKVLPKSSGVGVEVEDAQQALDSPSPENSIPILRKKLRKKKDELKRARNKIIWLKLKVLNLSMEVEEESSFGQKLIKHFQQQMTEPLSRQSLQPRFYGTEDLKKIGIVEPYASIFADSPSIVVLGRASPLPLDPNLITTLFKRQIDHTTYELLRMTQQLGNESLREEAFPMELITKHIAQRRRCKRDYLEFVIRKVVGNVCNSNKNESGSSCFQS